MNAWELHYIVQENKRDGVKYFNISDALERCPFYDNNKPRPFYSFDKINLRLGLIPKKDIEDKRRELVSYYKACEPYLTNDMRIAINNEDVKGFGALVSRLTATNPDGTVARRDPGWEELFDFEIKFEDYLELKNKNVETEDILKELAQPRQVSRRKR